MCKFLADPCCTDTVLALKCELSSILTPVSLPHEYGLLVTRMWTSCRSNSCLLAASLMWTSCQTGAALLPKRYGFPFRTDMPQVTQSFCRDMSFLPCACELLCPMDGINLPGMIWETPTSNLVASDRLLELCAPST